MDNVCQLTASDWCWGCKEIAREINTTERAAYHLLTKGTIPGRKVGKQWVASRKKLRERLLGGEEAA